MKITIIAAGSRGDVQPMIALGLRLQSSGHKVRFAADKLFEDFVNQYGLDYFPVRYDIKKMFESEAGKKALESNNVITSQIAFGKLVNPIMTNFGNDCCLACQGQDAIIYSLIGPLIGASLFEKYKIPTIFAHLQPQDPTKYFPAFSLPIQRNMGALINRLTHYIQDFISWPNYRLGVNNWRQTGLNLPPVGINHFQDTRSLLFPTIYGFSSHIIHKPKDWGNNIEIAGYWYLDDLDWQPPKELTDFLEVGPPPICISFGSMVIKNPVEVNDVILKTLARTKQRGILLTGWSGIDLSNTLSDQVLKLDSVPHSWLFPRMAAVIHHGGGGTTGAGLRAGIPNIIVPFMYDQPFWGQRIFELGVGPKPIQIKKLTVERLSEAINTVVTDNNMQQQAAKIGKLIQAEDGLGNAVAAIERFLS